QASNQSTSDEVFFLTSGNAGTSLIHYTYAVNKKGAVSFFQAGSLALSPGASAGVAADRSQLPVRLAITFTNGTVKLATISTGFGMSLSSGSSVPATVAGGPTWCCGAAPTQIGVAQRHGFYVFDAGL